MHYRCLKFTKDFKTLHHKGQFLFSWTSVCLCVLWNFFLDEANLSASLLEILSETSLHNQNNSIYVSVIAPSPDLIQAKRQKVHTLVNVDH